MAKYVFLCFMAVALMAGVDLFGQKVDTIYHINGNILTGDFKKMEFGVVTWKMDGMGTISLEEPKINTIKSDKQFEIKINNGMTYFGSFDTSGYTKMVKIIMKNGTVLLHVDDIAEAFPIKRNFWLRTSGNFSLGVNYSKGSDLATVTVAGNLDYIKRNSKYLLSWDDYNTFQSDTLTSTKADASFSWERTLKKKWALGTGIGLSQNSELGTKLRFDISFVGIYDISYNKWNRFNVAAGISGQRETPYDTSGISNDIVAIGGIYWKVYKYTRPKVWVDASLTMVPYLTSTGRFRGNLVVNPKVSVISDNMKVGFRFYYSLDNRPQTQTAAKNDWGINFEVTYSLH